MDRGVLVRVHRYRISRWPSFRRTLAPIVVATSACTGRRVDRPPDDTGSAGESMLDADDVASAASTASTESAETEGSGTTEPPPCVDDGCPCAVDRDCESGDLCNPVLGACVSSACAPGMEACPCAQGGLCLAEHTCDQGFCTDYDCPTGSAGCDCIPFGTCMSGLQCVDGRCMPADRD